MEISSATHKCRRPQITPTRNLHCRSHSRLWSLPIFHRHCRGLPRRMAMYAKAASAALLWHMPAARVQSLRIMMQPQAFANCNLDAQRAFRPRRRFRFLCRCCACIVHSPYRMCGTNSFIGPTQLAVFHFTRTMHFGTHPAWSWHAQLMPITAI